MAFPFKTAKGFKAIKVDVSEIESEHETQYCSKCGDTIYKGYLVGLLGSGILCGKCFHEWHDEAIYSEDIKEDEEKSIDAMMKAIEEIVA